jgi:hypothetical protein
MLALLKRIEDSNGHCGVGDGAKGRSGKLAL